MLRPEHRRPQAPFLIESFELIGREPVWPPKDPSKIIELGKRYDTLGRRLRRSAKLVLMCRSIKVLRTREAPATSDEVKAAALQFIRKISGMRKPSKANEEAFDRAVLEVSAASDRLLEALGVPAPSRADREHRSQATASPSHPA